MTTIDNWMIARTEMIIFKKVLGTKIENLKIKMECVWKFQEKNNEI